MTQKRIHSLLAKAFYHHIKTARSDANTLLNIWMYDEPIASMGAWPEYLLQQIAVSLYSRTGSGHSQWKVEAIQWGTRFSHLTGDLESMEDQLKSVKQFAAPNNMTRLWHKLQPCFWTSYSRCTTERHWQIWCSRNRFLWNLIL